MPCAHPELKVSTPAHAKYQGWCVDLGVPGGAHLLGQPGRALRRGDDLAAVLRHELPRDQRLVAFQPEALPWGLEGRPAVSSHRWWISALPLKRVTPSGSRAVLSEDGSQALRGALLLKPPVGTGRAGRARLEVALDQHAAVKAVLAAAAASLLAGAHALG